MARKSSLVLILCVALLAEQFSPALSADSGLCFGFLRLVVGRLFGYTASMTKRFRNYASSSPAKSYSGPQYCFGKGPRKSPNCIANDKYCGKDEYNCCLNKGNSGDRLVCAKKTAISYYYCYEDKDNEC